MCDRSINQLLLLLYRAEMICESEEQVKDLRKTCIDALREQGINIEDSKQANALRQMLIKFDRQREQGIYVLTVQDYDLQRNRTVSESRYTLASIQQAKDVLFNAQLRRSANCMITNVITIGDGFTKRWQDVKPFTQWGFALMEEREHAWDGHVWRPVKVKAEGSHA